MSIFLLIVVGLPLVHVLWWICADRMLAGLKRGTPWRILLAVFALAGLGGYVAMFALRLAGRPVEIPAPLMAGLYLWYLVVLPTAIALLSAHGLINAVRYSLRRVVALVVPRRDVAITAAAAAGAGRDAIAPEPWTRRELLATAAAAVPPAVLVGTQLAAMEQLEDFRVRSFEVRLPRLPAALDGLTIAHVSDVHVGKFTRGAVLDRIARRANDLDADLVCVTGDLIDFSLDDLPEAVDLLRSLRSRHGTFVCEGNHDLFESRTEFERQVREAGLNMLINAERTLSIRGETVQLVGLRWGEPGMGRGPMVERNVEAVAPLLRDDAFKLLLAHHPHAFDAAADAGIDFTLAGHTHGGQLMLTPKLGPGSWMFKYWTGLYERGPNAMVVSNGVGNWFPLRINAPAELVHVTLRRAERRDALPA